MDLRNVMSSVYIPFCLSAQREKSEHAPTGSQAQRKSCTAPRTSSRVWPGPLHENQHPPQKKPLPGAAGAWTALLQI